MKKILNVFIVITLVLIAGCLFAQQVTISGSVIDAKTGDPLAYANVSIEGKDVGAATDEDGYFSFAMDLTAEATLVVSYMGYKKQTLVLRPGDPRSTQDLLFELEPDVIGKTVFEIGKRSACSVIGVQADTSSQATQP